MAASLQVLRTQGLLWRRLFGGISTYETNTGKQVKINNVLKTDLRFHIKLDLNIL
jgi:hypothetical protein